MEKNISTILTNGTLMDMNDNALDYVLNKEYMEIPQEIELFDAMLVWADKKCTDDKLEITAANRREALKDRLFHVRFATMNVLTFNKCVFKVGPGFFTNEEIVNTLFCISMGFESKVATLPNTPFSHEHRLRRVEVHTKKIATKGVLYTGSETIFKSSSIHYWLVKGFESDSIIDQIVDVTSGKNLEFSSKGKQVLFTKALSFNESKSIAFRIQLKPLFGLKFSTELPFWPKINSFDVVEATQSHPVFLQPDLPTAITAILIERR